MVFYRGQNLSTSVVPREIHEGGRRIPHDEMFRTKIMKAHQRKTASISSYKANKYQENWLEREFANILLRVESWSQLRSSLLGVRAGHLAKLSTYRIHVLLSSWDW